MNKEQESHFQEYIESEKIRLPRIMCLLSAILFSIFAIVDTWALSSVHTSSLLIRSFVVCTLILTYLLTFHRNFVKYYSFIMTSVFSIAILGIEAMVYLSSPTDIAFNGYYVGIILVLIVLFSWTHLSFKNSLALAFFALGLYLYTEVIARGAVENGRLFILLTNIFFIVSAIIIGVVAQQIRYSNLQQNSLLQQSLSKALEAKTEEAEDYEYKANHDHLTGLPNRRYATVLLEGSLEVAKEKDRVLVIMFVDLNGFKRINDIHGHAAGDEVLTIVAKRLELAVRKSDCLARIGGDEYLIGLLLDKENIAEVEHMAEKFATIISEPMNVEGTMFEVGASVGIAAYPYHGEHVEVLMEIADKKMYQIKQDINDSTDSSIVFFEKNIAN